MKENEPESNLFDKKTLNQSEFLKATGYNLLGCVALWFIITVLFFVIGAITEKVAPSTTGWDRPVVLVFWGLIAMLFISIQVTLLVKLLKIKE